MERWQKKQRWQTRNSGDEKKRLVGKHDETRSGTTLHLLALRLLSFL